MRCLTWQAISARPDPMALFEALGSRALKQMAAKGDGEALFSQGCLLVSRADGVPGTPLGASGKYRPSTLHRRISGGSPDRDA